MYLCAHPTQAGLALLACAALTLSACSKKDPAGGTGGGTASSQTPTSQTGGASGGTTGGGQGSAKGPTGPSTPEPSQGKLTLTLDGDGFSPAQTVEIPVTASMTQAFPTSPWRQLTAQGPIEVPGKGKVTLDLGLFLPREPAMAPGKFNGGTVMDPAIKQPKSLVTLAFGISQEDTFKAAYGSTAGEFTITEVGPKFRGKVKGTFDAKLAHTETKAPLHIKGAYEITHIQ